MLKVLSALALVVGANATVPCTQCPRGTYAMENKCEECPVGRVSQVLGSITETDCEVCPAGFGASSDRQRCERCPAGTYSTKESDCIPCDFGFFSTIPGAETADVCAKCPEGSQSRDDRSGCDLCPSGQYGLKQAEGDDLWIPQCFTCAGDRVSSRGATFRDVPSVTPCDSCPPGYSPNDDRSACNPCPEGTYEDDQSRGTCQECPRYTYAKGLGRYQSNPFNDVCTRCGDGYEPAYKTAEFQGIVFETTSGASSCRQCPAGSYSNNNGECQTCQQAGAYGTTPGLDISKSDEACDKRCQPGYEPNPERNGCRPCQPGFYQNPNTLRCDRCNANEYCPFEAMINTLSNCPLGQAIRYSGTVVVYGVEYSGLSTSCYTCEPGTYSNNGLFCSQCPADQIAPNAGTFNPAVGQPCEECPTGKISNVQQRTGGPNSNTFCTCRDGQWEDTSLFGQIFEPCKTCPLGKTTGEIVGLTTVPTSAAGCVTCPVGTYGSENTVSNFTSCNLCPSGTFNGNEGSGQFADCQDCAAGRFSESGASECTDCEPGRYQAGTQASSCIACAAGKYRAQSGADDVAQCLDCPAGKYSEAGQAECIDCPLGTFDSPFDRSACLPCPAGTSNDAPGSTSAAACKTCSADSVSLPSAYGESMWSSGPWSKCNGDCVMSRDIRCVNAWGQPASGCDEAARPASSTRCETQEQSLIGFLYPQCITCPVSAPVSCYPGDVSNGDVTSAPCATDTNSCGKPEQVIRVKYRVSDGGYSTLTRPDQYEAVKEDFASSIRDWAFAEGSFNFDYPVVFETTEVRKLDNNELQVTGHFFVDEISSQFSETSTTTTLSNHTQDCLDLRTLTAFATVKDCQAVCLTVEDCVRADWNAGTQECCSRGSTGATTNNALWRSHSKTQQCTGGRAAVCMSANYAEQFYIEYESNGNLFSYLSGDVVNPSLDAVGAASGDDDEGISSSVMTAIIIGGVIFFILLVFIIFMVCKKKNQGGGSTRASKPPQTKKASQPETEMQSTKPAGEVANKWEERISQDPQSLGHVYYVNKATGESRWVKPADY